MNETCPERWQIITVQGVDAGMLDVAYQPDAVYLARIELLPGYQGRGVGAGLIRALIAEAHRRGQPLELDVLAVNHRAQALYRRLGLREVPRTDGDPLRLRMRSAPPTRRARPGRQGRPGRGELTGRAGRGPGRFTGLAYHRSCG